MKTPRRPTRKTTLWEPVSSLQVVGSQEPCRRLSSRLAGQRQSRSCLCLGEWSLLHLDCCSCFCSHRWPRAPFPASSGRSSSCRPALGRSRAPADCSQRRRQAASRPPDSRELTSWARQRPPRAPAGPRGPRQRPLVAADRSQTASAAAAPTVHPTGGRLASCRSGPRLLPATNGAASRWGWLLAPHRVAATY